jgi:hypothetical protein
MARHEPLGRDAPGEPPPDGKLVMRRDAKGRLQVVVPPRKLTETTEAAERPPTPEDPRTANQRNVPPYGGGF